MKTYSFTIDGQSVSSDQTFEVRNPANNELLGYAPISSDDQVREAILSAKSAQKH
ncbi:MAG: hypothetical protein AAFQ94_18260 [Bacteroidota bacterium]